MEIFQSESRGDLESSDRAIQELKEIMGTKDETFQGTDMQDATEFFGLLLSEVRDSRVELGVLEADLVTLNFAFEMEETLECCSCKDQSRKLKKEISMWCDVDQLTRSANCEVYGRNMNNL